MCRFWLLVLCLKRERFVQVFAGANIIWVCQVSSHSWQSPYGLPVWADTAHCPLAAACG